MVEFNTIESSGRNFWGHCALNSIFHSEEGKFVEDL